VTTFCDNAELSAFSKETTLMASLRRGLVDKVKQAAEKVGKRGAQVAAKAGTRGARALVETTAAAVKTVDKLQSKLGRGSRKPSAASAPMTAVPKTAEAVMPKAKRASTTRTPEAQPVALRESGRKTTPAAAAAKRSKAPAPKKAFKAKRGQKHLHSGR
jgi:hypothetical protein